MIGHIRYSISRALIHLGLRIMPEGAYKTELLEVLWELNRHVHQTVHGDK